MLDKCLAGNISSRSPAIQALDRVTLGDEFGTPSAKVQKGIDDCRHYRQSSCNVFLQMSTGGKAGKQYSRFHDHLCLRGKMRLVKHQHADEPPTRLIKL